MPTLSADALTAFVTALFRGAGVPDGEARTVATSLVGANLRGHDSHGVMRAPQYIGFLEKGEYRTGVDLVVEHETPAVVVCDGQWGFGQVQAHRLLDRIIPRARALGVASGTARDVGHIGRLGEYAERAAEEGLILIATVNNGGAGQRVAPPGGTAPRLGTNPLCAAVPTAGEPVVLDFGTSVVAEGKVRVYQINRKPVPEGWLLDPDGRPTTDPSVLYNPPLGSILPMGGAQAYKGFGLALVLDMLSGGLTGGRCSHPGAPPARGNNVVFVAFDPEKFAGREALVRESTGLVDYVRATPGAPGVDAITLPGDPERRTLAARSRDGIPLEDAHWEKLVELARKTGDGRPRRGVRGPRPSESDHGHEIRFDLRGDRGGLCPQRPLRPGEASGGRVSPRDVMLIMAMAWAAGWLAIGLPVIGAAASQAPWTDTIPDTVALLALAEAPFVLVLAAIGAASLINRAASLTNRKKPTASHPLD